ncbi:FkbM family methyltransferase [Marivita hallyeonensis]|uniref:Methyltransferase, FkbM family n=1 Tax=Marivita hallyeonensis TaxID=996342 RepID=A0A1M5WVR3_9RHOB|nr:FkbM family methyltransferase [Marivita hallyeonensis]SHH91492.1 methyltransferase, FkbM family [Marivita hallyeonensis]
MLIGVRPKMVVNRVRDFLLSRLGDDTVHYVQVGANDGLMDDPVYKIAEARNWSGVLIEPNPTYFSELSKRYKGRNNFTLVNCGVSDKTGTLKLHHLSKTGETKYPEWAKGCATLDKTRLETVLSGVAAPEDDDIESTDIKVRTLSSILKAEKIKTTDLLVVDVEGHEMAVLKGATLSKIKPKAILIESNGKDEKEDAQIRAHLSKAGYTLHRMGDDIFGYSEDFPAITPEEMMELIGLQKVS